MHRGSRDYDVEEKSSIAKMMKYVSVQLVRHTVVL